jgi:hypothetical protein
MTKLYYSAITHSYLTFGDDVVLDDGRPARIAVVESLPRVFNGRHVPAKQTGYFIALADLQSWLSSRGYDEGDYQEGEVVQ